MTITVPETFTISGDLTIRRLGFGAMRLTGPGIIGEPLDREGARWPRFRSWRSTASWDCGVAAIFD